MIGPTLKPQEVYNNRKWKCIEKWRRIQNPIVCIKLWFIARDNMNIYSKYVISKRNIQFWKRNKMKVIIECSNCLLNKSIMTCWNKQSVKILDINIKWWTNIWFCGSWDKCNCSAIWSQFGICYCSQITSTNQMVQLKAKLSC
jgi:hypothetical protein